jgi:hypothetical protein
MNHHDTTSGIRGSLSSLDGLKELLVRRREAAVSGSGLGEFYILGGRFFLDQSGNILRVVEMESSTAPVTMEPRVLHPDLAQVVEASAILRILPSFNSLSTTFALPASKDACDECGEGWTLGTCHDAILVDACSPKPETPARFMHEACARLHRDRDQRAQYRSILENAGLSLAVCSPAPNGYYANAPPWYAPPWCSARTPKGAIVFGWRKRVIAIDWTEVAVHGRDRYDSDKNETMTAEVLFPGEDVTKSLYGIHAYGPAKAGDYIEAVARAARIGRYRSNER